MYTVEGALYERPSAAVIFEAARYRACASRTAATARMKRLMGHLYFWVLLAILGGGIFGYVNPPAAVKLKPLGDGFIALVKMLISPVIFCTVVLGIAGAGNMKKVGRVGGKALIYFEIVSTFALIIGLLVVNIVKPGAGFNADPRTLDANAVTQSERRAKAQQISSCTSSPQPSSMHLPDREIYCRCCSWPSSLDMR